MEHNTFNQPSEPPQNSRLKQSRSKHMLEVYPRHLSRYIYTYLYRCKITHGTRLGFRDRNKMSSVFLNNTIRVVRTAVELGWRFGTGLLNNFYCYRAAAEKISHISSGLRENATIAMIIVHY